jgi:hypothetical protein
MEEGSGEPEVKRPLGILRCRWEGNIKMLFKEWDGWAWTGMPWLRIDGQVAGSCECGNEPSGPINCGGFLDYLRS